MPAVEGALIYSLERIYQPPAKDVLSTLDIVVVLGGGAWPSGVFSKYPEASGATYSRLFNGVEIFKQSSAKTLVLSGGESEAEVMKTLAIRLAVCEDKILTETKSCNTMQQIIEFTKIFPPAEKMRIGIVTSALHMLRSEKSFRKKFSADAIVPIPVNYTYTPVKYNLESFIPSSETFTGSTYALHEWIGIAWYAIRY